MENFRRVVMILSIIVVAGGLGFYFFVAAGGSSEWGEGTYELVAFDRLRHDPTSPGYLLCSNPACGTSDADGPSVFIEASVAQIRRAIASITDTSPSLTLIDLDIVKGQFEIGQNISGKPYYGIVSVLVLPVTEERSELVVYAHQPVGKHDKADNAARARRIVDTLTLQSATF